MFPDEIPAWGDERLRAEAVSLLGVWARTRRLLRSRALANAAEGNAPVLQALEMQILIAIAVGPDQTVGELAARLELIPQTVSKALKRLRDEKLVVDAKEAGDRRTRTHCATRRGSELAEQFVRATIAEN